MKIGAQLYTLRDFCKNPDDFSETLKKVADIGYTTVQVSGTCAYTAEWLRDELNKNGLTCGITHFSFDRILNETEAVIEEHKTFGCSYIGIGGMPGGTAKYAEFIAEPKLRPAMDKIAAAGCLFMYHNHNGEYETVLDDGRPVMFHLSDEFTPAQMGFTLDTSLGVSGSKKRIDIGILDEEDLIMAVVECKASLLGIDEAAHAQAEDYLRSLNTRYFFVTDGNSITGYFFNTLQFIKLEEIPKYSEWYNYPSEG